MSMTSINVEVACPAVWVFESMAGSRVDSAEKVEKSEEEDITGE